MHQGFCVYFWPYFKFIPIIPIDLALISPNQVSPSQFHTHTLSSDSYRNLAWMQAFRLNVCFFVWYLFFDLVGIYTQTQRKQADIMYVIGFHFIHPIFCMQTLWKWFGRAITFLQTYTQTRSHTHTHEQMNRREKKSPIESVTITKTSAGMSDSETEWPTHKINTLICLFIYLLVGWLVGWSIVVFCCCCFLHWNTFGESFKMNRFVLLF